MDKDFIQKLYETISELKGDISNIKEDIQIGKYEIINTIHSKEQNLIQGLMDKDKRLERLETYVSQGKWAIGLLSLPVAGGIIRHFIEIFQHGNR